MTRMARTRLPALLALSAGLALGGCISFGEKPPATLMSLTADAAITPGTTRSASDRTAVAVLVPAVPQALATQRVPVQAGMNAIAYLQNALWVEAPNRLFRQVLADTIEARTGRMVPDLRGAGVSPDTRLGGRLEMFGLDAPSGNAVVRYDATLAHSGSDSVTERRFEARVPVTSQDGPGVAAGLNAASNQVAVEVADWVGR